MTDSGDDTAGFKDGTNGGDDYLYDDNGNMTKDLNKGITSIAYNHLNLPTRVEKDANNYILYTYDATGIKLRQEVYEGGAPTKTTDYAGEFIYENDTLQFIQHEEGRIVPALDTGPQNWDYEYRIDDHLGNTRVMFTTNPKEIDFTLNYESSASNPDDEAIFSDLGNIIEANVHDRTDAGSLYQRSQRLTGTADAAIGSVLTIPVGAGDRISASVYAKYLAPTATNNPGVAIGALLAAATSGGTGGTTYEGAINSSYGPSGSIITNLLNSQIDPARPMAFLNLLFLPGEGASSIDPGQFTFKQISPSSSNAHALLTLDEPFEALGAGHVVVYLSNESEVLTEVYFDDLVIMVNEHPVVQTADYYPGGLTHGNGFQRITTPKNNYLFNGKEHIPDLDLNWDDYGARMYMPEIGRWSTIDPLAEIQEGFSPYHFVYGNPIRFNDPTGMIGELGQQGIQSTFIDPDGNIIDVRDDGDRSIYLVHDLENWDGSKGGLAVVGATPEPATLKNFVGQNLYSERVAGYMFQEAERLNHEAWSLAWNKTKAMGELLKSRDEQLRIMEQIKSLNREQMITLLKILKTKELLQHIEKGKGDILNWIGIRTLLNILASQGKNINLPGDTAGDFIMPDDKIYEKALEHRELEKQIIERYDKMINDIQNRN